jgi:hypothetical protein
MELRKQIEDAAYLELESAYTGPDVNPKKLEPLCSISDIKLNADDLADTCKQVFKRLRQRMVPVINLEPH